MKRKLLSAHAIFTKALIIFSLFILFQMNSFAQGPKWTTLGNETAAGDFIGSTNFQPLEFRTNNIPRGAFSASGDFQLNNLIGTGNRLLQTDANGNIISFSMGTASDVLYGNGTWGSLPPSLWNASGSNIYYNLGNIGIGTNSPLYRLDVIGDARISNNLYVGGGIIITERVNANAEVITGKMQADSIVTDSTKGFYGTTKFNGNVKLQNKLSVDGNAIINGSLNANSITTNDISTTNFNVSALLSANKITAYRITPQLGDSLIRFGDSTIAINTAQNRITFTPSGIYQGLSLGFGTIAKGFQSLVFGVGTRTGTAGFRSVVIGSGNLENNTPQSLMIGFNSNVPTMFVSTSAGPGTTGNIGIGTTYIPAGFKLAVEGKIICEEVKVLLRTTWPDYVFSENYELLSLAELEKYLKTNKHLPEMPNAEEIEREGINTSEMITNLLKKQEELTLYIIEQNKRIQVLENKEN